MKKIIAAILLAMIVSGCTLDETYYWDIVNGKPKGQTARELCELDPYGNQGLCPTPAASDAYATDPVHYEPLMPERKWKKAELSEGTGWSWSGADNDG